MLKVMDGGWLNKGDEITPWQNNMTMYACGIRDLGRTGLRIMLPASP